jgi:hypothetical protein
VICFAATLLPSAVRAWSRIAARRAAGFIRPTRRSWRWKPLSNISCGTVSANLPARSRATRPFLLRRTALPNTVADSAIEPTPMSGPAK